MKTESVFRLLYTVVHPFFTLLHPVKAIGRENIPEGSAVICPNHTTASDPFYVVFAFGKNYPMWAMAKQQVLNWPVVGWILGKAGVFGVERGAADLKAAKTALRCLKENRKLLIFPEVTRVQEGESVTPRPVLRFLLPEAVRPCCLYILNPARSSFARLRW